MNFPVSENVERMKSSSTFKAMQAAANLREQGFDVIDLTVGEPDFPTPEFIKNLAIEGLNKGITKYTPAAGMKPFVEAVPHFYAAQFGAEISPKEVAASCGGKQALFNAACTILNPGDECLIPKPYWVTFPEIVTFTGAKSVFIETEETDFVLTAEQVKAAITDKTKLLIINSPSNPTGRVIPSDEMRKIIEVCAERNVYVLTDECYLFFVYRARRSFHVGSFAERIARFRLRRGQFFKNLRDDRLENRLHDCKRRLDKSDYQTAKSFGDASDIFRAICLRPRDGTPRRINERRPDDACRIQTAARLADSRTQ